MRRLDKCCFCYDLHRGSVAIAVVYIVVTALGLILGATFLVSDPTSSFDHQNDDDFITNPIDPTSIEKQEEAQNPPYNWLDIVDLLVSGIEFVLSCTLLYGLLKKKPVLILLWLIVEGISLVVGYIALAADFVVSVLDGSAVPIVIVMLVGVPFLGVATYFTLVIYSQYLNVRDVVNIGGGTGNVNYNRFNNDVSMTADAPSTTEVANPA